MTAIRQPLLILVLGVLLQACEKPDHHPIIGTWEGNSENTFGLVTNVLTFEDDGTYSWKQIYVGLKEIMEERSPDIDWGDFGFEIIGKYALVNDEITLTPQEGNQLYGGEYVEGGPMFPIFEEGYDYIHTYYFAGADLIINGDTGEDITFKKK